MDEDDDPFQSLTAFCHVSSSQEEILRAAPISRQNEQFPELNDSVSYDIPVDSTEIRMVSPPEEEFLTPDEDSLPAVSFGELAAAVVAGSTVVIVDGGEGFGNDPDELRVEGSRISENIEALRSDTEIVDSVADQVFDEMAMENQEAIDTVVVDLGEEDDTCRDFLPGNADMEMVSNENISTENGSDCDELYGDLTKKNLVDEKEVLRDGLRGSGEKGTETIDNFKRLAPKSDDNSQKGMGIGGLSELFGDLPPKESEIENVMEKKIDEPCRDGNRGFAGKGVVEIDKAKRSDDCQKVICIGGSSEVLGSFSQRNQEAKTVHIEGDEPSKDEICDNGIDLPMRKDNHEKGKGLVGGRELPSSLRVPADIAISGADVSNIERNKGFAEKNINEKDKSKYVGQTSRRSCGLSELPISKEMNSNDLLLHGLSLIIRGKKADDKEVDILETAMDRGVFLPRPRWWPPVGSDDD